MRAACRAQGLQFLDDTVALQSVRPMRGDDGQLALRRVYGFEFSDTGTNRRGGKVCLIAARITDVDLGLEFATARTLSAGTIAVREDSGGAEATPGGDGRDPAPGSSRPAPLDGDAPPRG
jgi:hypothetical protein